MEIVAIVSLISAIMALTRTGILSYIEVREVIKKYEALNATPENIEALRQELLSKAQVSQAVDDPTIRAILEADGIDPETLRIT